MSLTLVLSLYALFFPFYSQPNRTADQGLFLLKKIKFIWIQIDLYKDATNPKNNKKKKKVFFCWSSNCWGFDFYKWNTSGLKFDFWIKIHK